MCSLCLWFVIQNPRTAKGKRISAVFIFFFLHVLSLTTNILTLIKGCEWLFLYRAFGPSDTSFLVIGTFENVKLQLSVFTFRERVSYVGTCHLACVSFTYCKAVTTDSSSEQFSESPYEMHLMSTRCIYYYHHHHRRHHRHRYYI
jgi:hypothetical protein